MKKYKIVLLALLIFDFGITNVFAKKVVYDDGGGGAVTSKTTTEERECKALFGDPNTPNSLAWYFQKSFNIIKYVGIVLCLVFIMVDVLKYILSDEKDTKNIINKTLRRLIYMVIIFFIPALVKMLMSFVGAYGTCGIK